MTQSYTEVTSIKKGEVCPFDAAMGVHTPLLPANSDGEHEPQHSDSESDGGFADEITTSTSLDQAQGWSTGALVTVVGVIVTLFVYGIYGYSSPEQNRETLERKDSDNEVELLEQEVSCSQEDTEDAIRSSESSELQESESGAAVVETESQISVFPQPAKTNALLTKMRIPAQYRAKFPCYMKYFLVFAVLVTAIAFLALYVSEQQENTELEESLSKSKKDLQTEKNKANSSSYTTTPAAIITTTTENLEPEEPESLKALDYFPVSKNALSAVFSAGDGSTTKLSNLRAYQDISLKNGDLSIPAGTALNLKAGGSFDSAILEWTTSGTEYSYILTRAEAGMLEPGRIVQEYTAVSTAALSPTNVTPGRMTDAEVKSFDTETDIQRFILNEDLEITDTNSISKTFAAGTVLEMSGVDSEHVKIVGFEKNGGSATLDSVAKSSVSPKIQSLDKVVMASDLKAISFGATKYYEVVGHYIHLGRRDFYPGSILKFTRDDNDFGYTIQGLSPDDNSIMSGRANGAARDYSGSFRGFLTDMFNRSTAHTGAHTGYLREKKMNSIDGGADKVRVGRKGLFGNGDYVGKVVKTISEDLFDSGKLHITLGTGEVITVPSSHKARALSNLVEPKD